MSAKNSQIFFTEQLLAWNKKANKRAMPWKFEKDPYRIWLSEIILQQTRVDQGMAYYNRFVEQYPDIKQLAEAPDTAVFKLWEGLGYYSRCKNLLSTARLIAGEMDGIFPDTYEGILKLKGVGPYTAAAIASFAYNLPYAVVDGNVMRVLARFFAIDTPVDSNEGKKLFAALSMQLLKKGMAGKYNQAIMDFGATVCKPQIPLCHTCMLAEKCSAYKAQKVMDYPVKSKKINKRIRFFYYVIASCKGKYFIRKRTEKDIWQNLHEFILFEKDFQISPEALIHSAEFQKIAGENAGIEKISVMYRQQLTHQTIQGYFIHMRLKKMLPVTGYGAVARKDLLTLAFPKFITGYFKELEGDF